MSAVHGRGRLTDADRELITALADQGMKAPAIAKAIKRHPATINWFMYSSGLQAPKHNPNRPASYMRGGRCVRAFSPDEDVFIEALRVQDYSPREIAEYANKRFSTGRTHHTVRCRLVMLAARESAA